MVPRHASGFDVTLHDRLHDYAMLAVQGPEARGIVADLAEASCPSASAPRADRGRRARTSSSAARATRARTASSC